MMQSTGLTVNRIDPSPTSVSAITVSGSKENNKRSRRGTMSETESETGEITEDVFIINNGTGRCVVVQSFIFGDQ